jgi:predicted thioesterase
MSLHPGMTHEITRTVTPDLTADALGNKGVMVFATPSVLTFIENACSELSSSPISPNFSRTS